MFQKCSNHCSSIIWCTAALTTTIKWLHTHPIEFSWLTQQLSLFLGSFLAPNIISLQQWNLPVAVTCPSSHFSDIKTLSRQIPSLQYLTDWPDLLYPSQGDFGRQIKKQLVSHFLLLLTVPQKHSFKSIARHTLHLSPASHVLHSQLTESQAPSTNVWWCATSLFSLTCFYELSNQAFLTTAALLLDHLDSPRTLFTGYSSSIHAKTDVWADALLNKPAHAAGTRNSTYIICTRTDPHLK
jgi:hypothetical protein